MHFLLERAVDGHNSDATMPGTGLDKHTEPGRSPMSFNNHDFKKQKTQTQLKCTINFFFQTLFILEIPPHCHIHPLLDDASSSQMNSGCVHFWSISRHYLYTSLNCRGLVDIDSSVHREEQFCLTHTIMQLI